MTTNHTQYPFTATQSRQIVQHDEGLGGENRFPLNPFKAFCMVLTAFAFLIFSQSATASIFNKDVLWPTDLNGAAYIRVCVIPGSSVDQRSDEWYQTGLAHEPNPSLNTVVDRVQKALASSWGRLGTVHFYDWRSCDSLNDAEKSQAVGLYIGPDATNQATGGIGKSNTGHVTRFDRGVQFKPWAKGSKSTGCIYYSGWNARMEYSFDCVEQYAIHEFGHVIGISHEHAHPLRPSSCVTDPEGPWSPPKYSIANANAYDWDSIMAYSNGGTCAHNSNGVKFGGANLSSWDVAGLRSAYPSRYRAFATYVLQTGTVLQETDSKWTFAVHADTDDIIAIQKNGTPTRTTEIRVLTAASGYKAYASPTKTALGETNDSWEFLLAPNRDLVAIKKNGTGTRTTEVHILTAASNYQSYSLQTGTIQGETGNNYKFLIAPNRDIVAIKMYATGTGRTEVHVLSAATNYQSWSLQTGTILGETSDAFEFLMAPNRDILAIKKYWTHSQTTEVHALSAANNYQSYALQTGTPMPMTDSKWQFVVTKNTDIIGIKKANTGTRSTELHRLR